ncbi:hypothetical protein L1887_06166 [Cichorium endivia]|nr:hypothetical protein L1887_06166 [Cichorium endivia]
MTTQVARSMQSDSIIQPGNEIAIGHISFTVASPILNTPETYLLVKKIGSSLANLKKTAGPDVIRIRVRGTKLKHADGSRFPLVAIGG